MIRFISRTLAGPGRLVLVGFLLPVLLWPAGGAGEDEAASLEVEQPESPSAAMLLRWQLPEERQLALSLEQTTDTITTAGPRTLRMRLETAATFDWLVEEVSESGVMRIRQTWKTLRLRMVPADSGELIQFDSTSDDPLRGAARDLAEIAGPLIGTELVLSLSPRGELVEVEIPDATREVFEQVALGEPHALRVRPADFLQSIQQTLVVFPEEPVDEGATWEVPTDIPDHPLGPLRRTSQFTYRSASSPAEVSPDDHSSELPRLAVSGRVTYTGVDESVRSAMRLRAQSFSGLFHFDPELKGISWGQLEQRLQLESQFQSDPITVRLTSTTGWQLQRD